ncbi:unnamed protein product [Mesocestoides corti]|uniref:NAD(+) ADP-ribosyltransferase n=1 Tax=Mesocestoides corti TaxID=53468 RepID=A0A0R3UHU9_MESCO|nr:unnamed protein product [Mesocestoides corti]
MGFKVITQDQRAHVDQVCVCVHARTRSLCSLGPTALIIRHQPLNQSEDTSLSLKEVQDDADDNDTKEEAPKKQVESPLPPEVFAFIALISDVWGMERQMREMNHDARRAPLGKLTQSQMKAGCYQAPKDVSDRLEELKKLTTTDLTTTTGKKTGNVKRKSSDASLKRAIQNRLLRACNNFYTRIPYDFG